MACYYVSFFLTKTVSQSQKAIRRGKITAFIGGAVAEHAYDRSATAEGNWNKSYCKYLQG